MLASGLGHWFRSGWRWLRLLLAARNRTGALRVAEERGGL